MKLLIDTDARTATRMDGATSQIADLFTSEAFEWISREWVRVGWSLKYAYQFTWLGRPIIQLPEDMLRIQEVIYRIRPDVIVETGVAHGGSLIYYASLCHLQGKGRVVGVDIEIRPHNRNAIEAHEMADRISLIEGDSTSPHVVGQVASLIRPGHVVLVLLDSCHTKAHVRRELDAYCRLVTPGSYLIATDGIMRDLSDVPGGGADWATNHPAAAAEEFAAVHPEFLLERPSWPFSESKLHSDVTHWSGNWLKRVAGDRTDFPSDSGPRHAISN
jgi:cephalosporin hydroxylase